MAWLVELDHPLAAVDVYDKRLTPAESVAFLRMFEKYEKYVWLGRAHDAHGAGTMILLLWESLIGFEDLHRRIVSRVSPAVDEYEQSIGGESRQFEPTAPYRTQFPKTEVDPWGD